MKIVVAYSGGLDTSVLLKWLKEKYNAEIIAYCADVGQAEELDGLEAKALATGASKCFIGDLKEDFATNYIFPMMQANALYEGRYLLGTSIARPCISKDMVDLAIREGADAIAHGATGKGNDQVRFELAVNALAPNIKVIAPWRDPEFRQQFPGRTEMIAYAESHGIPIRQSLKKPYSMDRNLLHISFEAGMLEDTWYDGTTPADREMYKLSVSPEDAPDQAEYIQLLYEKGNVIGIQYDGLDALLKELGVTEVYGKEKKRWYVKAPAFSFAKIRGMDSYLSPEMKSTGEAIGYDDKLTRALYKALQATGMNVCNYGTIFVTIADHDKEQALPLVRRFYDLGFNVEATTGTAEFLREHGIRTRTRRKLSEGSSEIIDALRQGHVSYVINTIDINQHNTRLDGYEIRRTAVENNVTIFTALETVQVLLDVLEEITFGVSTIDAK